MATSAMMVPTTTVQELAAAVEEPPSRYVRPDQERDAGLLAAADEMPQPIPLIDLSRLLTDADEADKLRAALQTWGIFLATNHGIEESLMDTMMSASREFFRQPVEEKKKCSNLVEGKPFEVEGYGNDKVATQDQILDWHDRLHLRVEPEDQRNFAKWPRHPESFRRAKETKHIIFKNRMTASQAVLKTVQELAAAVDEPPSRYVRPELDRHADEMPEPIPLIDLSRLNNDDEADKLRAALQTWGLFLVTNHGIEDSLMDAMMSASREFFRQPAEEKKKCSNIVEGKPYEIEGYGNERAVSQDQILDWQDRLHLRVEPENERNFAKWPSHPESFRDVLHEYASRTKIMRDVILRSIAKLLELDEEYFVNQQSNQAPGFARFNYYPPCPRPDLVLGLKSHSDGGLLTILLVDQDVGGLQVQRDGKWYNVPAKPYTLVINLADCMEIMNNGIFKSPVHRVATNAEKERLSLAIFYGVDEEMVLEPGQRPVCLMTSDHKNIRH